MRKLTSRKFWIAVSQIVAGVLVMFQFSEETAGIVAGAVMALSSAITYIVVEGKIDSAGVANTIEIVADAYDALLEDVRTEESYGKADPFTD